MYKSLSRVFKLCGECSNFWTASNGLLQGCPISMLALNALVSVVLEINDQACPDVTARTYADDISATCVAQSQEALVTNIAKFHRVVKSLEELQFGELSTKKCYTFGNTCLKGKLDFQYEHQHAFKIVGGSFISDDNSKSFAATEHSRYKKWTDTVKRMRHCPLPWRDKAKMLLATKSQATYGQGTHSFTLHDDVLTPIRSDIMRAMYSTDFYSMNPHLTFAILLPPQLDPFFGHIYQGLRTLARCLHEPQFRHNCQNVLSRSARKSIEGPTRKVRRL